MNKEFLDYYSSNLSFMRKLGTEFAQEFPKIASRLDLNPLECQDPFIERLLEGTAFLTARIEQKLDLGYPRFLEAVLQSVSPLSLTPIPSGAVICPNPSKFKQSQLPYEIKAGANFSNNVKISSNEIKFSSLINTRLLPLQVDGAEFLKNSEKIAKISGSSHKTALSLDLSCMGEKSFGSLDIDYLDFYLNLPVDDNSLLCELLFSNLEAVYLESEGRLAKIDNAMLELSLFDEKDNLLQHVSPSLLGLNLIYLYNAYPDFMRLIRLKNLKEAMHSINSRNASLIFIFNQDARMPETRLRSNFFLLNCIPIVNLFRARSNRNFISQEYEVNVNVDATTPLDYEIFTIQHLEFFDKNNQFLFNAYPFYSVKASENINYRNYFSVNRRARQTGLNGSKRSPYNKNEVFISIAGADFKEHLGEELQFSAECYCTNADLPLFIAQNDSIKAKDFGEGSEFKFLSPLTRPHLPLVNSGTQDDFKKLAFVLQNFSNMLMGSAQECLYNLKNIVKSFSLYSQEQTSLLESCLEQLKIENKTFRFVERGYVYFENGYAVKIILDEKKLKGIGLFAFTRLIASLLQSYAPINVPLEFEGYSLSKHRIYACKILGN